MSKHFKQRMLLGSLGMIGLIFCIYYSFTPLFKPLFILLNAGVISLALLEYYRLAYSKGFQPSTQCAIGATVAYMIALGFSFHQPFLAVLPSSLLLVSFLLFFLSFFHQTSSSIGNLAITVFGLTYLTIPLSCAIKINYFFPVGELKDGRLWLAYALVTSKMTDIGAYFCGKSFGKTKLAPSISPKKTLEGALGGIGAALTASLAFFLLFPTNQLTTSLGITWTQSFGIGLLISILAQLGDLAESLLKRDAGVKDSSHLPGLGGMLDIVDSLVFTLPFVYLLLEMHLIG